MTASHPGRRARPTLALLAAGLLLGVSACSGDSSTTPEQTPEDILGAARQALDDTSGVTVSLTTEALPDGVDGVLDATGTGTHAPAFDGSIKVLINGLSVDVPVVAVDGLVYAKLPFTLRYAEIDPGDYGAPDPADLLATEGGVSSWLTAATGVTEGDQVRDGDQVLTSYSGSVPGDAIASVIPSADDTATFEATFEIDDGGRLTSADVTGPFYGDQGEVDYTLTLADYGTEKDITAP